MTEQDKIIIFDALIKPFLRDDSQTSEHQEDNLFAPAIRQLINSSLRAQQGKHLGCERYERMPTRNGQRNGFKARTIRTSTGQITLDVPQVRNAQTPFIPIIPGFERGSRIDRALNLDIAEMYLQGVSTRKVAKVMNEICGGNGISEAPTSWKALTDNLNAEQTLSPSSPPKLQQTAEELKAASSQPKNHAT